MTKLIFSAFAITIMMFTLTEARAQNTPPPSKPITKTEQNKVITTLLQKMHDNYIFPDVAKKAQTEIRKNIKQGKYAAITDSKAFAKTLTDDLREIVKDKHLSVHFRPDMPAGEVNDTVAARQREERFMRHMRRLNLGFPKADILEGNIGYFRIDGFGPVDKVGETCTGAMMFLANTEALIIDLRYNHGGDPDMVRYLASYFFGDAPVHINSLYYRVGNKTEEYWTIPVKGQKYLNKPVYVLTSAKTFSGGEELAYDLQTQKRGTLIGETTGGGANPGDEVALGNGFVAFIPNGRAVNPITNTNWEGVGVKPDITVLADNALKEAHTLALKTLAETAVDDEAKDYYRQNLEKVAKK